MIFKHVCFVVTLLDKLLVTNITLGFIISSIDLQASAPHFTRYLIALSSIVNFSLVLHNFISTLEHFVTNFTFMVVVF